MTQPVSLVANNVLPGTTFGIETSSLPSGVLSLTSASAGTHYVQLLDAKSDAGVPLTATPTSGAMGISRTAGTSLQLLGEATSASAKTDKAIFAATLPATYIAGSNFSVVVNCLATGGTITAASTTMTVVVYYEALGVETALTVSAAQEIPATNTALTFSVTGVAGLVAGTQIVIELTMLVTTSASAGQGTVNSVAFLA